MKVTFPHLGNIYISVKGMFDDLGIDYIIPPLNNKETLEIGTRYAPESVCLPLKITIGNLIQAHMLGGADTVLMAGGRGPCRFGYYCEMQREILADIGIDMKFIVLEPPKGNPVEYLNQLRELVGTINPVKLFKAAGRFITIAGRVDDLENTVFKIRPRAVKKHVVDEIYDRFRKDVLKTGGSENILKLLNRAGEELAAVKLNERFNPLKVGIVGEIYTNIDQFTSFDIQKRLGYLGAEVDRKITISNWISEHIVKKALHIPVNKDYQRAAKPYLNRMIGGHALETVGNTILYARNGYDGVIQLFPLNCMPEIVSESLLKEISRDFDIPVLTLIIDEMTGEAGYMTRLDAFIDMLWSRREDLRRQTKNTHLV